MTAVEQTECVFCAIELIACKLFVLDPENHRISASPPSFMRRVPVHSFANPIVFFCEKEKK